MTSSKRRAIPDTIVIYALYLLAAAVPLVFVYQTYDIFELAKLTFLRLITLVLAGAWAWQRARGAADYKEYKEYKDDMGEKRWVARAPLDWFIVAYLGVMALATVFSPSFKIALLGEYGRYEGLLTLLNYGAVFFLTGSLIRDLYPTADLKDGSYKGKTGKATADLKHGSYKGKTEMAPVDLKDGSHTKITAAWRARTEFVRNLVMAAISGGALVSIYGITQRFGLDFLVWSNVGTDTTRSFSTLGNPIYVAAYATIILSLALALFVVERHIWRRVFLGLSATLVATCLVMTYSRAGWAGAVVALGLLGVWGLSRLWGARSHGKIKSKTVILSILLIITIILAIGGAVTLSEKNASTPTQSALTRALSSFNLASAGLADRVSLWKSGVAMIKDRPILGWGPETFGTYYPQYRRMDMVTFERVTSHLSRPRYQNRVHSDILQQAISGGLLGALAYIAMIGAFFWFAFRSLRHARDGLDKAMLIGIIAGLVGYFIQIQVSFSTIAVSPLVWMLMAVAMLFERGVPATNRELTNPRRGRVAPLLEEKRKRTTKVTLLAVAYVVLIGLAILSFMPLAADYYFNSTVNALEQNDTTGAERMLNQAQILNPYVADYPDYGATSFVIAAKNSTDGATTAGFLTTSIAYADRAIELNPAMASYRYNRGNAEYYYSQLQGLDQTSIQANVVAAVDDFKFAVAKDPYIADYHFNLASAYMRYGLKSQAIAELKSGLRIDPTRTDAKLWLKNLGE